MFKLNNTSPISDRYLNNLGKSYTNLKSIRLLILIKITEKKFNL